MSDLKDEEEDKSSVSSCLSLKSDRSMGRLPPDFSNEPGPSDTKGKRKSGVPVEEQPSSCALCQDVLKDPVSTSCGHWFCRQCITSYWEQRPPSGDPSCPQCGERPITRAGLQTASQTSSVRAESGLQQVLDEHRLSLRRRCERVTEGTDQSETLLNRIFTELYITQGQSEEVNTQHEVRQLETASKKETLHDTPIKCQDIFKALPDQQTLIRAVLTHGVAGVGKTFSVQKFTLDWAEGLGNQDVSLVIPLSFRELNLIKGEQYSLLRCSMFSIQPYRSLYGCTDRKGPSIEERDVDDDTSLSGISGDRQEGQQHRSAGQDFPAVMTMAAECAGLPLPPPLPPRPVSRLRFTPLPGIWRCVEATWRQPLRTKAPVATWAGILRVEGHSDTECPGVPPLDESLAAHLLPQTAGWAEGRRPPLSRDREILEYLARGADGGGGQMAAVASNLGVLGVSLISPQQDTPAPPAPRLRTGVIIQTAAWAR
ncbi:uncharacterized protein LOC117551874 [Gymnodraco acuticeps]|uniref:Uncharacterized protein LOC117551874 n=1 Tax=Gymnodraco acuticeps TaxID=8218 RepID=A0A6P8VZ44_GYMAC|nr:uncharacterized protein LOC117551874 [Gymnodraco acuticeps]